MATDRGALEPERAPLVLGAQLDAPEILELDQHAAVLETTSSANSSGVLSSPSERTVNSRRSDSIRPGRHLDVAAPDGLLHVLHGQAARRQLGGGQPHPHREAALAEDPRLAHARQRLQARSSPAGRRCPRAGAGRSSRPRARASRTAARPPPAWRPPARARPPAGGRGCGPPCRARPARRPRRRRSRLNSSVMLLNPSALELVRVRRPFDRAQLLLQDVGDGRLDHLRVGARELGADRDDRRIDVGELAHGQPGVPDGAEQHERQAHHAGEHRPADGQVGELHERYPTGGSGTY